MRSSISVLLVGAVAALANVKMAPADAPWTSISYSMYIGKSSTIVETGPAAMFDEYDTNDHIVTTTATTFLATPLPMSIVPSDVLSSLGGSNMPTTLVMDTSLPEGHPLTVSPTEHTTTTTAFSTTSDQTTSLSIKSSTEKTTTALSSKGSQTATDSSGTPNSTSASSSHNTDMPINTNGAKHTIDSVSTMLLVLCLILGLATLI